MSINAMKMFLALGDLTSNENATIQSKVEYKQKIVFATMKNLIPDWQPPSNWDILTDEDKLEILQKLEKV
jgi:hypothetical protein|tara:strand:- start:594 stop:803 length:210 start_codon:yes stop_codon:yes gene_type:complete